MWAVSVQTSKHWLCSSDLSCMCDIMASLDLGDHLPWGSVLKACNTLLSVKIHTCAVQKWIQKFIHKFVGSLPWLLSFPQSHQYFLPSPPARKLGFSPLCFAMRFPPLCLHVEMNKSNEDSSLPTHSSISAFLERKAASLRFIGTCQSPQLSLGCHWGIT